MSINLGDIRQGMYGLIDKMLAPLERASKDLERSELDNIDLRHERDDLLARMDALLRVNEVMKAERQLLNQELMDAKNELVSVATERDDFRDRLTRILTHVASLGSLVQEAIKSAEQNALGPKNLDEARSNIKKILEEEIPLKAGNPLFKGNLPTFLDKGNQQ